MEGEMLEKIFDYSQIRGLKDEGRIIRRILYRNKSRPFKKKKSRQSFSFFFCQLSSVHILPQKEAHVVDLY